MNRNPGNLSGTITDRAKADKHRSARLASMAENVQTMLADHEDALINSQSMTQRRVTFNQMRGAIMRQVREMVDKSTWE